MTFPVPYASVLERIDALDPNAYARERNYLNGTVSYLSPYISRGVLSTKQIMERLLRQGHSLEAMEKFIQELVWRDYWQLQGRLNPDAVEKGIRPQPRGEREGVPHNLRNHQTGILAVDQGIELLYQTGYLHNHLRMYIASLCCNIARCHWKEPARWMYYYLLDADWASNALSWQWVAGVNSNKMYFANQENINKYTGMQQLDSFLQVSYSELEELPIPDILREVDSMPLPTMLPKFTQPSVDLNLPTLVYNFYNVDPLWRKEIPANRVLLLEPSIFKQYPVSDRSIAFCIQLAQENIPGIQVLVDEFSSLRTMVNGDIYFKEHPLNRYNGQEDARETISTIHGEFNSFHGYWKKVKREIF